MGYVAAIARTCRELSIPGTYTFIFQKFVEIEIDEVNMLSGDFIPFLLFDKKNVLEWRNRANSGR